MSDLWKLAALLALLTTPAQAQQDCAPTGAMLAGLEASFGEYPAYQGSAIDRPVTMTITVNPETGTWTVLITSDAGVSCMAAIGDNWLTLPAPEPGKPI